MNLLTRIEHELEGILATTTAADVPPLLSQALRHAVFPGGARVRPRLCMAVALACETQDLAAALAAAASIELLHCASLVHDDLPCFDDAALRRGQPSVHKAYGERLAVLAGDGLIVLAFQSLSRVAARDPARFAELFGIVATAVNAVSGIVAGQAWECEPQLDLSRYHQGKTGALFAAAAMAGARASGRDAAPWRLFGERLGEAFQVADDLRDVLASVVELGKVPGRDADLGRPSAVNELGVSGALARLDHLIAEAQRAIPACPGSTLLHKLIRTESARLLPKALVRRAA
ncbi:MAG: polyprenyl synthetase family protein [Proteobacteria bacterium]|nr:polyprenyl synthetase family protein [Pseudomonadota bacterium]